MSKISPKTACNEVVVIKEMFKAGLGHVSFHSLRHTNASMRIQAGQNIKYIQTQLGHASINITLDTYGHLFNEPLASLFVVRQAHHERKKSNDFNKPTVHPELVEG